MKVIAGIPSNGQWNAEFGMAWSALLANCLHDFSLMPFGAQSSIVAEGRNLIVEGADRLGADALLFLDSDMVFPPDTLHRLAALNKPIAGATYRQRNPQGRVLGTELDGSHVTAESLIASSDPREVADLPTGILLIRRQVWEAMPHPRFRFGINPRTNALIGEDTLFCFMARQAGFSVWLDPVLSREIGHVGTLIYPTLMPKMEDGPGFDVRDDTKLSILIPTRNRPEGLRRLLDSIVAHAARMDAVEIIVGMDDDEVPPAWLAELPFPITLSHAPREQTMGRMWERLLNLSSGEIIVGVCDDLVVATDAFDARIRTEVRAHPNAVHFIDDEQAPNFATFPVTTRKLAQRVTQAQGFFMPPWFPFWFVDTWWDELGELIGVRRVLPVRVLMQDGKGETTSMRELGFWSHLFDVTRPMRVAVAEEITGQIIPQERINRCKARAAHLLDPAFIAHWEGKARAGEANPRYDAAKAEAEALLLSLGMGEAA